MFLRTEPIHRENYSLHLLMWDHRRPEAIAISPDGRLLATSFDNNSDIIIWLKNDVGRWEPIRATGGSCRGLSVCTRLLFSHDSRRLFAGWSDGGVLNWRIDVTGELTSRRQDIVEMPDPPPFRLTELDGFWQHDSQVAGLSLAPGGHGLCSRSVNGEVIVSFINEDGIRAASEQSPKLITQALFLPNDKLLLADMEKGLFEAELRFDARMTRTEIAFPTEPFAPAAKGNHCTALAISPDGQRLAVGHYNGELVVYGRGARGDWRQQSAADFHGARLNALSFSPDGSRLASGSSDRTVRLWHPRTCVCLCTFDGFLSEIWQLQFNPADGRELVVAAPWHDLNRDVKAVTVLTLGSKFLPDRPDPLYPGRKRPDWLPLR